MNDENKTPSDQPTPATPTPAVTPVDTVRPPAAAAAPTPDPVIPGVPPATAPTNEELAAMLATPPRPTADDEPENAPRPSALQKVSSGFMSVLGSVFSWIIFPLAVVLILHFFIFQAYHVIGTSMNPTLQQTDYLIVSKVGYTEALVGRLFHKDSLYLPSRGQIIVFHYPKDPTEVFVKRVIAEPGDHLVIKSGTVTLYTKDHPNGYNPDAAYEPAGTTTLIDTDEIIQPGNVFVMGDNRTPGGSYDSRDWGELPSSYIIGNAVLRLLPLDSVKIL
ncbi:signal peptidase I [Candidatus Saccharibacteria bacterium]|nr:signal peptidase I [Candidatus Saccharibacteria bacterium]